MAEPHAEMARTPARRKAILDAALVEFNAHGVAGASIEDIRRRSGTSVGSIYHHFGGKDGIAGALYLDGLSDYQEGFIGVVEGAKSARASVQEGVRQHVRWIHAHRDLARFLLLGRDARVVVATEREVRSQNRRFFSRVEGWARPWVRAGELREVQPELLVALWIGPSQELARHWLAGRPRNSLTEAAPALADAACRCLIP